MLKKTKGDVDWDDNSKPGKMALLWICHILSACFSITIPKLSPTSIFVFLVFFVLVNHYVRAK